MVRTQVVTIGTLLLLLWPLGASAQERLCDPQTEDCRAPLIDLIRNEQIGIDVAFWFMEDARYANELINRFKAGVPVRILVDQRANASKRLNEQTLTTLSTAGIPMRDKYVGDIMHFKMMLFHGQDMLEFSKANYTPSEFVPITPNVNYSDEGVFFTNDDRLTNTFRRKFDDLWTNTSSFRNFANITNPLVRNYPVYPIDPSMNFPPGQDFSDRAVSRYDLETQSIDAIVFRVTDHRQADAMIRAVARGVPVRIITDPGEYRNPVRVYDSKHVDRMFMGGVQLMMRKHEGIAHEASTIMHGLGEVIFGSSNWTTASAGYQDEHNFFYNPSLNKPWFFQWFADQFERKWNDTTNYVPFVPLPPGTPVYAAPTNGASGLSTSVTLKWEGGPWAHLYDIYFGSTSTPPLLVSNTEIGSPEANKGESFTVANLQPGTTYYWRVVGRTWAQLTNSGPVWSFTTAGTPPGGTGPTPFGGTPAAVPGTFQAENFDDGGQSVAYVDTTPGNSGAAYRSTDVDIQPTTDADGAFNVGWTKAGEWLKYTVNVAATGTYSLDTRVANIGTGARFHVEVDGVDRTGPISVPDTGAWQAWQTLTTAGIPLTAGVRVIRVVFDAVGTGGGVGNYNWFRFVQSTAPSNPTTPFGGTPAPIPGVVQAENFDVGAEGAAYHDTTAGNSGAAYRSTDVDIQPAADVDGAFNVGWTKLGEWLKYTVNISAAGTYQLETRVAVLGAGAKFHVEVDGADATGAIAVPDSGGWQTWQTITTPAVSLPAGEHALRVVFDAVGTSGGAGNFNWFRFTQVTTPTP
jgi:carbohydrate binding protein with CBM6 domain/phospholipase D-like protein